VKQAYPIANGTTVWHVDNAQGRRVLATCEGGSVHHTPVLLARNKRELDQLVRVLRVLRDDLPDPPGGEEAARA
jgi:hypothetical protein